MKTTKSSNFSYLLFLYAGSRTGSRKSSRDSSDSEILAKVIDFKSQAEVKIETILLKLPRTKIGNIESRVFAKTHVDKFLESRVFNYSLVPNRRPVPSYVSY